LYNKEKLEAKAKVLAQNAADLFSNSDFKNADGISFILDIIFPADNSGSEMIRYALFEPDGRVAASTAGSNIELPFTAMQGTYTHVGDTVVQSYYPVTIDGAVRYILMIHIDNTPFLQHSRQLSDSLHTSLFRGCLMMAAGYAFFSVITNLRRKKDPDENDDPEEDSPEEDSRKPKENRSLYRVIMQLVSLLVCAVAAIPLLRLYMVSEGFLQVFSLISGGLLMSVAAAHLCRILLWFIRWYTRRPISGYSAQTMQFLVFYWYSCPCIAIRSKIVTVCRSS